MRLDRIGVQDDLAAAAECEAKAGAATTGNGAYFSWP